MPNDMREKGQAFVHSDARFPLFVFSHCFDLPFGIFALAVSMLLLPPRFGAAVELAPVAVRQAREWNWSNMVPGTIKEYESDIRRRFSRKNRSFRRTHNEPGTRVWP